MPKEKLTSRKLLVFVFIAIVVAVTGCKGCMGSAYDKWEISSTQFKVRATAFHEEIPFFMPGAFYVYESAPIGSEQWRGIVTFYVDDPMPIRSDTFRFVNENVGYINSYDNVIVTTDAGKTWKSSETRIYGGVTNVQIAEDGSGTLSVTGCSGTNAPCTTKHFKTADFGMTWQKE